MISPTREDIVLIDLGDLSKVVGHEQANIRPCLVIQTLAFAQLAIIVPLTTKSPSAAFYSIVEIEAGIGGLLKDSYALCHQIRVVSYHRITRKIGILSIDKFNEVLTVLADFLDV